MHPLAGRVNDETRLLVGEREREIAVLERRLQKILWVLLIEWDLKTPWSLKCPFESVRKIRKMIERGRLLQARYRACVFMT